MSAFLPAACNGWRYVGDILPIPGIPECSAVLNGAPQSSHAGDATKPDLKWCSLRYEKPVRSWAKDDDVLRDSEGDE